MFNTSLAKRFRKPLSQAIGAIRWLEQLLGPEDDWVEDDRRHLFQFLDGKFGHAFTKEKTERDYFTTAHATPDTVEVALTNAGYQRNLVSTRKYRTHHSGGKQWAVGSYVYDPADTDWQHHVFLFPSPDGRGSSTSGDSGANPDSVPRGGTDVYGHREASAREPVEHLTEPLEPGDPTNRVRDVFDAAGVAYGERNL